MKIDDVYKFIESLPEEDFYKYLTPESYYNTDLYNSICGDNLPLISRRKLLEIYFLLKENEDDITQLIFERMYEFSSAENEDDELEINGVNWYILIFYLSGSSDYYDKYSKLHTTNKLDKKTVDLIELNDKFDRDNHFIFNDTEQRESFYSKDMAECVLLACDRDKKTDFEKIIKEQEFNSRNITFKKNDLILYNNFKEIKEQKGRFFDNIRADFLSTKRDISISSILNERFVLRFKDFNRIENLKKTELKKNI